MPDGSTLAFLGGRTMLRGVAVAGIMMLAGRLYRGPGGYL